MRKIMIKGAKQFFIAFMLVVLMMTDTSVITFADTVSENNSNPTNDVEVIEDKDKNSDKTNNSDDDDEGKDSIEENNDDDIFEIEEEYGLSNPTHTCDTTKKGQYDYGTWSYVYFGSYPQSEVTDTATINAINAAIGANNTGDVAVNGVWYQKIDNSYCNNTDNFGESTYRYFKWERIKWRVLNVSGSKALLLADKCIDCERFSTEVGSKSGWATSMIRSYLNGYGASYNMPKNNYSTEGGSFINKAFTNAERNAIYSSFLDNNSTCGPMAGMEMQGPNTTDKIFYYPMKMLAIITMDFVHRMFLIL